MTHALTAAYEPGSHPHVPAGSSTGGQFAPTGGGNSSKPASGPQKTGHPAGHAPAHRPARRDSGTLAYDAGSNHGTGYDSEDGDPRVHRLQEALNRLGLTDSAGKPLKDDGKLGPKTTAAVKKAQHRLGLPTDGKVTPALLEQLAAAKTLPARKTAHPATKAVHAAAGPDLRDVELARPGTWKLASGDVTFTDQMLRDAADFFTASGGQAVPVKLGHNDSRFDGEPTFGSVTNVRYAHDARGPVLLGDIVGMPGWLAAAAPKRWPNRSIEGWRDFDYQGRSYSLVLSGLAFLGATPPGVLNIKSLADLQTALAASSAQPVFASAPADDPADPPHAPAPEAEEPITEGTGMDPVKIREALGLSADASDEEARAAFDDAFAVKEPEPEPVQASLFDDKAPAKTEPKKEPVPAAGSWMRVEASAWEAAQDRIKKLEAQEAKRRVAERDQVIAKAVQDGKFTPARREHWVRLWDHDPEGTREVIDGLARNVVPVMASGYAGDDSEDMDAEYAHLFPPTGKAASRG